MMRTVQLSARSTIDNWGGGGGHIHIFVFTDLKNQLISKEINNV